MLREYIRMIIEAEDKPEAVRQLSETEEIDELLSQILNKFRDDITHTTAWPYQDIIVVACNRHKLSNFWHVYNTNEDFKTSMYMSTLYSNGDIRHLQLMNAKVIKKYIRDDLKQYDVLVYFGNKLHQISKEKLAQLLNIAKNYQQFAVIVKHIAKPI